MRGPDPPTIWNVGKEGHSSDQHYLFLIIMAFSLCPSFMGHSKLKWPFFLQDQNSMFFRSFCTHFVLILLLKHILLRSISLFRLLFKSLFSFCLKKMVRSIIVKGGVSRERVVVKDSNDFSRLRGHWSRSVILTLTATNSLKIFSILSKCWDTLVPSCILLGKKTVAEETSCLQLSLTHTFSVESPRFLMQTQCLPLKLVPYLWPPLAQLRRTFFLLSTTIDAVHMLSFFVWLQQHHLIEEAISARSIGFSFLKNETENLVF